MPLTEGDEEIETERGRVKPAGFIITTQLDKYVLGTL